MRSANFVRGGVLRMPAMSRCAFARKALLASTALIAVSLAVPAMAADTTWIAGTGNWATGGNWDTATQPTGATTNTNIVNGGLAQINSAANAGTNLIVTGGSEVDLQTGGSLTVATSATFTASTLLLNGSASIGGNAFTAINLTNSTLSALQSGTLSTPALNLSNGTNSITAAAGTTLTIGSAFTFGNNTVTKFGSGTATGTINIGNGCCSGVFASATLEVVGGTLRATGTNLPFTTELTASTTVDAGAMLDFNDQTNGGGSTRVQNLLGAGTVNTGASSATVLGIGTGTFSGAVQGAGGLRVQNVSFINNGALVLTGANTYSGGTTIDASHTLQLGNGGATGSIVGDVANSGTLTFNRNNTYTFGGVISGTGAVNKMGTGLLVFTGANNYSGGTTISNGTLLIGDQTATGSIVGDVTNNGLLAFARNNAYSYGGVISGTGLVEMLGAGGNTTLTGINTYNGATIVGSGILSVNGSIANSSVTVNGTATLGGTGTVGPTTITSGGILAPGNSIGTITVNGALTFNAGGIYSVEVSPTAADRTNATGAVTISGGTVAVTAQAGAYGAKSYTIINGASRTGTFGALNIAGSFGNLVANPHLVYDATNVFLVLDKATLAALFPSGLSPNQSSVGNAIDRAYAGGGDPTALAALFNLSGNALANGLSQASGESATGAQTAGIQSMGSFLSLMLDPTVQGRGESFGPAALGYAPQDRLMTEAEAAYAAAMPVKAKPAFEQRWNVWAAGYGGSGSVDGNATVGSHDTTARTYGFAGGFDYRVTPDTLVGLALAGGGTNWGLSDSLGSGRSDVFQAGLYGSTHFGAGYVSGALAYAEHWASTDRTVTIGATERLAADFRAHSIGGRLETGYRFATPALGITPFAALQVQRFNTPSYRERATSGAGAFALAYDAKTTNATRTELGARFDKAIPMAQGQTLTFNARAAWAHDYQTGRSLNATFQTLPTASFTVDGAAPSANSALLSAGAELALINGWRLGGKFDAEWAANSRNYAGTGTLRYAW